MSRGELLVRFEKVSFDFGPMKPILHEVDLSIRRGAKLTLMGQNGAGKSTLFQLITQALKPESGKIHTEGFTIATARQVISREEMGLTVREFFEKVLTGKGKIYDIDRRIDKILEVVNLKAGHDRLIKSFSGGQQARLLLASALIQDPDLLLLDEPTNNLDQEGIAHLTRFLIDYKKTCVVISHDANFLNAFTEGVLYLDVFNHTIDQYMGNYLDLVKEISARIERENRKNAQLQKEIIANKEKANYFSHKGGQMRLVAKKMREKAEEMEEAKIDIRKEDKTIRPFVIQAQPELVGEIASLSSYQVMKGSKLVQKEVHISLKRNRHLLLTGPNGIGKSTLLEAIASGTAKGFWMSEEVRLGYYRQDFSTLNFEDTVRQSLASVMAMVVEENLRAVAAGFLLSGSVINTKIGHLSEGQKGLVAFARLVLQKPGLLILDEPTNHMNFRHLPVIAAALNKYEGAMILVSHVPEFVKQIRIDEVLDLEK